MQRSTPSPAASLVFRHGLDGFPHLVGMGLEVGYVPGLVQERREVSHGGEARLPGIPDSLEQLLSRVAENVVVDPRLVPGLAAHQLVHGDPEVFPCDVPHRDIHPPFAITPKRFVTRGQWGWASPRTATVGLRDEPTRAASAQLCQTWSYQNRSYQAEDDLQLLLTQYTTLLAVWLQAVLTTNRDCPEP